MRISRLSLPLMCLGGVNAARTISVAASVPKGASDPVDPAFCALAFETSSFYEYAMSDGKPNTFSQNLIHAISSRTGAAPVLRVGGTSGDLGRFNASQKQPTSRPATEGGPAFGKPFLQISPSYFKAYDSFPNAKYLFMVPFHHYWHGDDERLQNIIEWAGQGLKVIGDRLDALEIGNEPDFYKKWKFDTEKYIKKFNAVQKALSNKFKQLQGKPVYQALDKAYNPHVAVPVSGVRDKVNQVKQYAYHFYQHWGEYNEGILQRRIMNHTQTVRTMRPFASKVKYWKTKNRPIRLLMDEVGTTMKAGEGHNNLGTALWLADYLLHNMAIGMTRVHYQQIVAPGFNLWQPVKSKWTAPLARPTYYAMPFAADFIGGKNTRVHEIKISGSHTLSAYTAWENGKIARIAIINLDLWKKGQGNRPSPDFTIKGLKGIKSAKIEHLTAPDGALAENALSWSGLEWTWRSQGKANKLRDDTKTREVNDGVLKVSVDASSAMMITLKREPAPANVSTDSVTKAAVKDSTVSGGDVRTTTVVVTRTTTVPPR